MKIFRPTNPLTEKSAEERNEQTEKPLSLAEKAQFREQLRRQRE
jgi:hypothetical protein